MKTRKTRNHTANRRSFLGNLWSSVLTAGQRKRLPVQSTRPAFETLEGRQLMAVDLLGNINWVSAGPSPIINGQSENVASAGSGINPVVGAIQDTALHPTNPNIAYLASVNGGIWRSTDFATANPHYTPLTDQFPSTAISTIEFDLADATNNTLVAGTGSRSSFGFAGGQPIGLLRSTDGGDSWNQLGVAELSGKTVFGIAASGATIVVATDAGMWRSTNTGATFSPVLPASGLPAGANFDLVTDPTNASRLYVSVAGTGIYRSTNFGQTWTNVSSSDATLNARIVAPGNNNLEMAVGRNTGRVYATVMTNRRPTYIGFTDNQGASWTQMDMPVTLEGPLTITNATNATPIVLTIPNHGLAANDRIQVTGVTGNTAANGTFQVTVINGNTVSLQGSVGNGAYTGGGTAREFSSLSPSERAGGQGNIHFSIVVDPAADTTVYVGGDRQETPLTNSLGASDFSGRLFRGDTTIAAVSPGNLANQYSPQWEHLTHTLNAGFVNGGTPGNSAPHADSREMAFRADGVLIETDDGGVFGRTNPGNNTGNWFALASNPAGGLQITEMHDIAYDNVSNRLMSGNQDNGTSAQTATTGVWSTLNTPFSFFSTGDGGDVAVDELVGGGQSLRYISFNSLGLFYRSLYDAAGNFVPGSAQSVGLSGLVGGDSFPFVTGIQTNAGAAGRLIIASNFRVYESNNRGDNLSVIAGVGGNGDAIAYGTVGNPNALFVGVGSSVWGRTAPGNIVNTGALPGAGGIVDVKMDPTNFNTVVAVDNSRVYISNNAGGLWTNISGTLAVTNIQSVAYIPNPGAGPDAILIGTEKGVYRSFTNAPGVWSEFGTKLPNAVAWDMEYDVTDDILAVGTLGRGAWTMPAITTQAFIADNRVLQIDGDIAGPNTNEVIRLALDPVNTDYVDVFVNGKAYGPYEKALINSIVVNGLGGDDELVIDWANGNPLPAGGITFNGGTEATADGDKITLQNGTVNTVTYDLDTSSTGTIDIDGIVVTYTGLEPIADNLNAANRVFNFGAGNDTDVVLSDDGVAGDGMNTIAAPANAESVTFAYPTVSLTVDLGAGNDVIEMLQMDSAVPAGLAVNLNDLDFDLDEYRIAATRAGFTTNFNGGFPDSLVIGAIVGTNATDATDLAQFNTGVSTLDFIAGTINVANFGAVGELYVDDSGDTDADNAVVFTGSTITGASVGDINYTGNFGDIETIELALGTAGDTIDVQSTSAPDSFPQDGLGTFIFGNGGNDVFAINGDTLSGINQFRGGDGVDSFALTLTQDMGTLGVFPLTSVLIGGDATDGDSASRDQLDIVDNRFVFFSVNFELQPASTGDVDVQTLAGFFGPELNVRTMESVVYSNTFNTATVGVTGTAGTDDITIAPGNVTGAFGGDEALIFFGGNPWDGPADGLFGAALPGVAGPGASKGPDILVRGLQIGGGSSITVNGGGGVDDRLYVYGKTEFDIVDPVAQAATVPIFRGVGLGDGVVIPGAGFGAAYDTILVNDPNAVFPALPVAGVTITNPNFFSFPSIVFFDPTQFAQTNAANPGLVINSGDEIFPAANNIADDITVRLSPDFKIQVNGGDPVIGFAPNGDRLRVMTPDDISVFSDKIGNVGVTTQASPGIGWSSIERVDLNPGSGTVNLVGDNNDPLIDQPDNFIVVGQDTTFDGDGQGEFTLRINGDTVAPFAPAIYFAGVSFLNVLGDDLALTPSAGNDTDTLEITPYSDDTPRGWAIDTSFNEGLPNGVPEGNQADLLILHTSLLGGMTSEDIVIQPSGPDNGEVIVTNRGFGTPIADIDYIANTDIIVLDDDGFVNDTDTLTLRGTNPNTPNATGNDTFNVNLTAAGDSANPLVAVLDGATLLYRVRNFTGFNTLNIEALGGRDAVTVIGRNDGAIALAIDGGVDSLIDTVTYSGTANANDFLQVGVGPNNDTAITFAQRSAAAAFTRTNLTRVDVIAFSGGGGTGIDSLTVFGSDATNNVSVQPTTAFSGSVSVDGFPAVDYSTLGSGTAGTFSTIDLRSDNFQNGNLDSLNVIGTTGVDTYTYTPASATSANLLLATGGNSVNIRTLNFGSFAVNASGSVDTLNVAATNAIMTPGAVSGSGRITATNGGGQGLLPLDYSNVENADITGGTVVVTGTEQDDTVTVAGTGLVTVTNAGGIVIQSYDLSGAATIVIDALGGDDTINISGTFAGAVNVIGGDNGNGSDTLTVLGADVVVDLETLTVTGVVGGPVSLTGVEHLNVTATATITVNGQAIDDELTVTPTGATTTTIVPGLPGLLTINTDNPGALTIDGAGATDLVTVFGTDIGETINVVRGASTTVSVGALKTVTLPAGTEQLTVNALAGNDLIDVTGVGGPVITADGGSANALLDDVLQITSPVAFVEFDAGSQTGQVLAAGAINFRNLEQIVLVGDDTGPLFITGTAAADTITQVNNLIQVNDGPLVIFGAAAGSGFSFLSLNGQEGDNTFRLSPSSTPAALTQISVAGSQIGHNTAELLGSPFGNETYTYTPIAADSSLLTEIAAKGTTAVAFLGIDAVALDALGEVVADALTVTTVNAVFTPTGVGAGTVAPTDNAGLPLLGLTYAGIEIAAITGTTVVVQGTEEDDLITLDPVGILTVTNNLGFNNVTDLAGATNLVINALGGNDNITVTARAGVGLEVIGGEGVNVLTVIGANAVAETFSVVPDATPGDGTVNVNADAVVYSGLQDLRLIGNPGDADELVVIDDLADDIWTLAAAPGGLADRVQIAGREAVDYSFFSRTDLIDVLGAATFNVNPSTLVGNGVVTVFGNGVDDRMVVHGTAGADNLRVSANIGAIVGAQGTATANGVSIIFGSLSAVEFAGGSGDDVLTVDETFGLVNLTGGIEFNGGAAHDTLLLSTAALVPVPVAASYFPGPAVDGGTVTHVAGLVTQRVFFTGLEPVVDLVPGTYTLEATDANNAINYTAGNFSGIVDAVFNPAGVLTGLLSVDGFETYEFANKTTITINGNAGDDVINLNNPTTPTGLAAINVDGGDPTASDKLIVNGTTGANVFGYNPTSIGAGTVTRTGAPTVAFTTVESVVIDGRGGNDTLTHTTIAGTDLVQYTPGAASDSGLIETRSDGAGPTLVPLTFSHIGAQGITNFASTGGGREDILEINGTNNSDIFTINGPTDDLQIFTATFAFVTRLLDTAGVSDLRLRGLLGDDTFSLTGTLPYTSVFVDAGDPSTGSDVVNLTAAASAVAVNFAGTTTVTGYGGTVSLLGVELLNANANAQNFTVNGTTGNDAVDVRPTGAAAATVTRVSSAPAIGGTPVVNASNIGTTFTVNLLGGSDTLNIFGTAAGQTIDANVSGATGTVAISGGLITTSFPTAGTESLRLFGLEGSDRFNVTAGTIPVFVDGGDPVGVLPGDVLNVIGSVGFFAGPENDEGGFATLGGIVSFDHIESLITTAVAGCPFLIVGTNGDDDITVIARDSSTHAGTDGVRDFTVALNNSPEILFTNQAQLYIDGLGGDDDIVVRAPAPNLANWNTEVFVVGGPPSIGDPNEADRVVFETPGVNGLVFNPLGPDTANLIQDVGGAVGAYDAATDSILRLQSSFTFICDAPPGAPIEYTYISSPGGVELVEYDGEAADTITIGGTALNDTTVVNPTGIGTGTFRSGASPLFDFRSFTALTVNPGAGAADFDLVQIDGTAGADTVTSNANTITLGGTVTLAAGINRVSLNTYDGNDNIDLDLGIAGLEKFVDGGAGNDTIDLRGVVAAADPTIYGGDGNDIIFGSALADDIFGGNGNDTITAGPGADNVFGQADSDTLIWNNGDGTDLMEGGTGTDTVQVNGATAAAAGEQFRIQANGVRVRFDRLNLVAFTLDIAQVEQLDLNTDSSNDNAETVTINSLIGTELQVVNVDAGADLNNTLTLNASVAADHITVGALSTNSTAEQYLGLGPVINSLVFNGGAGDRVIINGLEGNDSISIDPSIMTSPPLFTLNGGGGNDVLNAAGVVLATILSGGAGNDVLTGGDGADTINGDAGEDRIITGAGADTVDGGTGYDTLAIVGTAGNDVLAGNQTNATTLVAFLNGASDTDTLVAGSIERVSIEAGDGNDTIYVQHAEILGTDASTTNSVLFAVDGGSAYTADRLIVQDNLASNTIIYRKSETATNGSVTVGPTGSPGFPAITEALETVFTGVEYVDPITGNADNIFVFKYDPYEWNGNRQNATHLGAGLALNFDPVIDPGTSAAPPPGFPAAAPADEDWYRIEAQETGTLDVQAFFRQNTGLPGAGNLDIELYDSDGLPAFIAQDADTDDNARVRIAAVEGQIYFLRVFPGVAGAINTYSLTILNDPAPVPFDLELADNLVLLSGAQEVPAVATTAAGTANFTLTNATTGAFDIDLFVSGVELTNTTPNPEITGAHLHLGAAGVNGAIIFDLGAPAGWVQEPNGIRLRRSGIIPPANIAALLSGGVYMNVHTTANAGGEIRGQILVNAVQGVSDTGRSQFDNHTNDTTPTFFIRVPDSILLNDVPDNGTAPGGPFDGTVLPISLVTDTATNVPNAPAAGPRTGFRVAFFVTERDTHNPVANGYATPVPGMPGVYQYTIPNVPGSVLSPDGSYFVSARLEMIDPQSPEQAQGFGAFATSFEFVVDSTIPPAVFGLANDATDGLHPDSDTGIAGQPATFTDNITSDTTPTFWGTAEANTVIKLFADLPGAGFGTFGPEDVQISLTTAHPLDGTNAFPNGNWQATTQINFNDPLYFPVQDGLRRVFMTSEDLAGNVNTNNTTLVQTIVMFLDTQGPQITDVDINTVNNPYDLFAPKPAISGPTPLVNSLVISVQDLPARVLPFLVPALNGTVALNPEHYRVVGDYNGNIPIATVTLNIPNPPAQPVAPVPGPVQGVVPPANIATGTITLTFFQALPDDRFTLTVTDALVDPAGNHLDGETNAAEPQAGFPQLPGTLLGIDGDSDPLAIPSGDTVPGGNFVARFTVDSRPEVGTWATGSTWVDTNGNTHFDPINADFVNRDITYQFGLLNDDVFAGNFVAARNGVADGFDKLAAYGLVNGQFRFLVDTDNDGVSNVTGASAVNPNGLPVAGNFDNAFAGGVANGDEVGVFTGTQWFFDTDHDFQADDFVLNTAQRGYPIVGDFDGDGFDDLGTFQSDTFFFDLSSVGATLNANLPGLDGTIDQQFNWGLVGTRERPVAADMNQDGFDDIGLWQPDRTGVVPQEGSEWYWLISGLVNNNDGGGQIGPAIVNAPGALFPDRVVFDAALGRNVVRYTPTPFGNDLFFQYGDEFGEPVVGNFDPPTSVPSTETNGRDQYDVDANGDIDAQDVLFSIYEYNRRRSTTPVPAATSQPLYPDVDRDGDVTPQDILYVVRAYIQRHAAGEGESVAGSLTDAVDAALTQDDLFDDGLFGNL